MLSIVIANQGDKPIYEQVYAQIASQILNGELEADYCLPSIRMVAKELGISIITVKKAWDMLEQEDLIYTRAGKGCFVSSHEGQLEDKKYILATEQFKKDAAYYKGLHISLEEFIGIAKKEY
jgi:GntR family transcriptional regulator